MNGVPIHAAGELVMLSWRRTGYLDAVSECGRYEIRGRYSKQGNFWNGWHAATGRLVAASGDKEYVKERCALDAVLQPYTARERDAA